jgi:hypothetical protein
MQVEREAFLELVDTAIASLTKEERRQVLAYAEKVSRVSYGGRETDGAKCLMYGAMPDRYEQWAGSVVSTSDAFSAAVYMFDDLVGRLTCFEERVLELVD